MPVSMGSYNRLSSSDNSFGRLPAVENVSLRPEIVLNQSSDPRFTGYQPFRDDDGNIVWVYKKFETTILDNAISEGLYNLVEP